MMEKRKDHAFGKDIFLLGEEQDGSKVWLEEASWDCDWYWGFGYVETYTWNNHPSQSRDIQSHRHWKGAIVGNIEYREDGERKTMYVHHINENPNFAETTLTDTESWKLAELMETFYTLQKMAEMCHMGGAHITSNPLQHHLKNEEWEKHINETLMPMIFEEVYKILTGDD